MAFTLLTKFSWIQHTGIPISTHPRCSTSREFIYSLDATRLSTSVAVLYFSSGSVLGETHTGRPPPALEASKRIRRDRMTGGVNGLSFGPLTSFSGISSACDDGGNGSRPSEIGAGRFGGLLRTAASEHGCWRRWFCPRELFEDEGGGADQLLSLVSRSSSTFSTVFVGSRETNGSLCRAVEQQQDRKRRFWRVLLFVRVVGV